MWLRSPHDPCHHEPSGETFFQRPVARQPKLKNIRHAQNKCKKLQKRKTAVKTWQPYTSTTRSIVFFTNKDIVHLRSDAPSTASVQKLGDTCTRVGEAEVLPICPERGNTITPNSKRRHRNCSTCRHNRLARAGIFTSVHFTKSQVHFLKTAVLDLRIVLIIIISSLT